MPPADGDALTGQCRVRVALPTEAVVERHVLLVTLTHPGRGGTLARSTDAGEVADAADVEHRVLRYAAVEVGFGALRRVLVGGVAHLTGGQEARGAWRRQIQVQVEAQECALVVQFHVPVGDAGPLLNLIAHRDQHQKLFDRRTVGDQNRGDVGEIRHDHRQRRVHPIEQLANLIRGGRPLLEQPGHGTVLLPQLPGEVGQIHRPRLDRVGGVGLRIEDRCGVVREAGELGQVGLRIDRQVGRTLDESRYLGPESPNAV